MKKRMSWIGMAALICVLLMGVSNVLRHSGSTKKMEGVEAYLESRYPGEAFAVSGAQSGGRGAYAIVSPKNEPGATFRVFAGQGGAFEDTYYTLTLRQAARAEAERLVRSVFATACVLPRVYQLAQGETLDAYPTLDAYCEKKSANIDLRVVVDAGEAAAFTRENMEKALHALAERFASETVVFSLAAPGKMGDVQRMSYQQAEAAAKDWGTEHVKGRIQADGSCQLR